MANNGVGSLKDIRKKFHFTHELISTAYHESGHTIYGLVKLLKIESVCVFENKKSKRIEGFTHYYSKDPLQCNDPTLFNYWLTAEICCKYAGLSAEKFYFKTISGSDKFPMFLREGSSDDTLSAASLINQFDLAPPGKKRYVLKKNLIKETFKIIQMYWSDISLISHNLFKRKRLNFDDLKILLTKKSINKQFWKQQFQIISLIYDNNEASLDDKKLKYILSI